MKDIVFLVVRLPWILSLSLLGDALLSEKPKKKRL